MSRKLLFLIVIAFVGFSCDSKEVYFQFSEIDNAKWSKSDTLSFEIDSSLIDVDKQYMLFLETINNTEYLYQNLWLYVYDDFGSVHYCKSEQEYMLSDSLGRWEGDGFGSVYQLTLPYRDKISFAEKRNYHIKIVHGMLDEPLHGIEKIGIKLELQN